MRLKEHRDEIIEFMQRHGTHPEFVLSAKERGLLDTKAVQAVESYLLEVCEFGRLLILAGPPGRGKSFAGDYARCATALWNSYYQPRGIFITAQDLYRLSINDEYQFERMTETSDLFIMDEVGAEHKSKSEFFKSLMDRIFNERWANRKPTIITTNYNETDFDTEYGDRVASRRKGWGWWIEIDGKKHSDLREEPKRRRSTLTAWAPEGQHV